MALAGGWFYIDVQKNERGDIVDIPTRGPKTVRAPQLPRARAIRSPRATQGDETRRVCVCVCVCAAPLRSEDAERGDEARHWFPHDPFPAEDTAPRRVRAGRAALREACRWPASPFSHAGLLLQAAGGRFRRPRAPLIGFWRW